MCMHYAQGTPINLRSPCTAHKANIKGFRWVLKIFRGVGFWLGQHHKTSHLSHFLYLRLFSFCVHFLFVVDEITLHKTEHSWLMPTQVIIRH